MTRFVMPQNLSIHIHADIVQQNPDMDMRLRGREKQVRAGMCLSKELQDF